MVEFIEIKSEVQRLKSGRQNTQEERKDGATVAVGERLLSLLRVASYCVNIGFLY